MSRGLVLIPTFYRPEYLAVCLDSILAARGGSDKEVWISQDRHVVDSSLLRANLYLVKEVIERFSNSFAGGIRYIERRPHSSIGNVLNFLELYKAAAEDPADRLCYLIEDDVQIAADFFDWHEAIMRRGNYFCSVGWHCVRNAEAQLDGDPHGYIESSRDFSSIGVCWPKASLREIARHANEAYYRHHREYLARTFPGSPIPAGQWTEQAGLIMRMLLAGNGEKVVTWPILARCAHIGIAGYHRPRGHKFLGNLEQRTAQLRAALQTSAELLGLSAERYDDINVLGEPPVWNGEQLVVAQRFKFEGKL